MKICTIVGARPQFVKASVVSRAIQAANEERVLAGMEPISELIVHTGQHYDANMSDVFFEEMKIPAPRYQLKIGGGTHGQNTGRMIEKVESILVEEKPNWVLVYGDTDSTIAGALAAAKLHIPVAHVEAGLRSFNKKMPEEVNRVLTDHISTLLITPTETATRNLANEGIKGSMVKQVGDVMYDASLHYEAIAKQYSRILMKVPVAEKGFVLATIHRAENTDNPERLEQILTGMSFSELPVVLPVHPRLSKRVAEYGLRIPSCIRTIEPVSYIDMIMLERSARLIMTDSGGVQKEAFFFRVPCITVRDETEWTETVVSGWNRLVKADSSAIRLALVENRDRPRAELKFYGDGKSGAAIVRSLCEWKQ